MDSGGGVVREWTVVEGDCVETMKALPDSSIDAIVCDPPYGISFMLREFDILGDGPAQQAWHLRWCVEALRVLKPGGYLLAFGGTRTYHRLACAVEDAGFEIRDSIASLHWVQVQGFPKSLDISKAITTPEAKRWKGWGSALKPSHEPVVVGRKPLIGTLAANVLKHGTGGLNIDGCRVATSDGYEKAWDKPVSSSSANVVLGGLAGEGRKMVDLSENKPAGGRWPPNVLLTHLPGCRRVGEHKVTGNGHYPATRGASGYDGGLHGQSGLDEKHTGTETIAAWTCAPGCAVAAMDQQSGITSSSGPGTKCNRRDENGKCQGHENATLNPTYHSDERTEDRSDTGFISRMFPQFEYDADDPFTVGFQYVPKPSTSEREAGCEALDPHRWEDERDPDSDGANNPRNRSQKQRFNPHPTVKPIGIMRWLARLVTPPGGTVLDPFCGSGTTGAACMLEGFDFIGCEKEAEYAAVARARIAHWRDRAAEPPPPPKAPRKPRASRTPAPVEAAPPPAPVAPPAPVEAAPVRGPGRRRRVETAPDDQLALFHRREE